MVIRTDLAKEIREKFDKNIELKGVSLHKYHNGNIAISEIEILSESGADQMGMPMGSYVTIEAESCLRMSEKSKNKLIFTIKNELQKICNKIYDQVLPKKILVIGIGNRNITSDSLGPMVVDGITITSHINRYFSAASEYDSCLSAIAPGVMAQTGMETADVIEGITEKLKPELVVIIDALASRSLEHVNSTYQISDAGISPGAGLGNNRHKIDKDTLGVPVIAIGVPTIVSAETIVYDTIKNIDKQNAEIQCLTSLKDKYVTTKNIDEEILCVSKILQKAINLALLQKK